ncbi:G-D-S-L family lipolytic protein [bacterium]|nr:G-D-S-L family lipolytic protein [bacterium]
MKSLMLYLTLGLLSCVIAGPTAVAEENSTPLQLFQKAQRVVFIGDSITYAGYYVADVETWMLTQNWSRYPEIIEVGLPSETVSGLSEDGHADGKFPRPTVMERLDRVLKVTQPNLVFACYGMNCGVYQPLDESRFERYQQGIRTLQKKVKAAGADLILITPPIYDDQKKPLGFSYDEVLGAYADWLLTLREEGQLVIDLHGPMLAAQREKQQSQPAFTFTPDAVHPDQAGHWFMAQQIIRALGDEKVVDDASSEAMLKRQMLSPAIRSLVYQKVTLLRDAYLSAAGHQRPGIKAGFPIQEAEVKARQLSQQIRIQLPRPTLSN